MVKQVSLIDTLEAQQEYVKAVQRGYGFTRQGNRTHYLFTAEQVEPSILESLAPAPFYIFTFVGCTMASATRYSAAPIVTPLQDASEWTKRTPNEL